MAHILLFYGMGAILIFLELFLPGGILGTAGFLCMAVSVILGFRHFGGTIGSYILLGEAITLGIWLLVMIKVFHRTWVGRKLTLSKSEAEYVGTDENLKSFLHKEGKALSHLRPAGVALIEGKRLDVVTEGIYLPPGSPVKVMEVEGNRVVVRKIERREENE